MPEVASGLASGESRFSFVGTSLLATMHPVFPSPKARALIIHAAALVHGVAAELRLAHVAQLGADAGLRVPRGLLDFSQRAPCVPRKGHHVFQNPFALFAKALTI